MTFPSDSCDDKNVLPHVVIDLSEAPEYFVRSFEKLLMVKEFIRVLERWEKQEKLTYLVLSPNKEESTNNYNVSDSWTVSIQYDGWSKEKGPEDVWRMFKTWLSIYSSTGRISIIERIDNPVWIDILKNDWTNYSLLEMGQSIRSVTEYCEKGLEDVARQLTNPIQT